MPDETVQPEWRSVDVDAAIEVRDITKRELDVRLVPWNVPIDTMQGREEFNPGAFSGTDPASVFLMGMDHEAHLGLGQDGRAVLTRRPVGKALRIDDRADAGYATFRVAKTQSGDEILTLAAEGIVTGVSIEFSEVPGGTTVETKSGRRTRVHNRVSLRGASTTYRPAYAGSAVIAVRSEEGDPPVSDQEIPAAVPAPVDLAPIMAQLTAMQTSNTERFAALEERNRSQIILPSGPVETVRPERGFWLQSVLRMLSGERIPQEQMRTLDDLVTSDNIGVVPPTYSTEVIGVISRRRPFLESTRKLATPDTGLSLIVPRIVTRPIVAQQMTEKAELQSDKTEIDTVTFEAVTKGGAGDISLQLLKRSSPSFLTLYLDLLAEAYAIESEKEAVEALLAAGSGSLIVNDGGVFDPETPSFGQSWINGYEAMYGGPDTIWLSSAAVGAFIDATNPATNAPLYSQLRADITAGGGVGGSISGLRPVHVPGLNGTGTDVLVGPSNGFAWAEDGTYTLQVDVPAKAGRDVALVGILWFAPLYPQAFTAWTLGS